MQTKLNWKQTSMSFQSEYHLLFWHPVLHNLTKASCLMSKLSKRFTVSGGDQMVFRSGSSNEHESACLK